MHDGFLGKQENVHGQFVGKLFFAAASISEQLLHVNDEVGAGRRRRIENVQPFGPRFEGRDAYFPSHDTSVGVVQILQDEFGGFGIKVEIEFAADA